VRRQRTGEDLAIDTIVLVVMVLVSLSIVYPFWKMLVDSFSTPAAAIKMGLKLLPEEASLQSYREVFSKNSVAIGYLNTLIRAISGTVLTLVVCMLAAYGIARMTLPFRKTITVFILFTMFFGGGLIPTYLWFKSLGLINTRFVLILPNIASAFYIIIMRNFFQELPPEMEESAVLDGAGIFTLLTRIIAPLSLPVIATVGLWSVVYHWNEWFDAMIYAARRDLIVLQLLLRRILIENQAAEWLELASEETAVTALTEDTVKAATMFVSIGPIIIAYPFIQRYFVKGIMVGSLKG
jgi:putative aldouronate transport system permease protein